MDNRWCRIVILERKKTNEVTLTLSQMRAWSELLGCLTDPGSTLELKRYSGEFGGYKVACRVPEITEVGTPLLPSAQH